MISNLHTNLAHKESFDMENDDPKYPAVYACDWVRQCLNQVVETRADAVKFINDMAYYGKQDRDTVYRQLADSYLRYLAYFEYADEYKDQSSDLLGLVYSQLKKVENERNSE